MISAEGRTHPVSTYFLEDVYERLDYCLALDAAASGTSMTGYRGKVRFSLFVTKNIEHLMRYIYYCK